MPEDNALPNESGQVAEQATPETQQEQGSEGPNWESQYNELRSDYTRKTQSLSEYEQLFGALQSDDPELKAQALDILGLAPNQNDNSDEFEQDDPISQLTAKIDQLEKHIKSQSEADQEEQQMNAEVEYLDTQFSALEKNLGRELTPQEVQVYASIAVNNPNADGKPDLEAAHQIVQGLQDNTIEQYRQSKQVNPVLAGTPDQKEVDFNDSESRARFMADYVKAHNAP